MLDRYLTDRLFRFVLCLRLVAGLVGGWLGLAFCLVSGSGGSFVNRFFFVLRVCVRGGSGAVVAVDWAVRAWVGCLFACGGCPGVFLFFGRSGVGGPDGAIVFSGLFFVWGRFFSPVDLSVFLSGDAFCFLIGGRSCCVCCFWGGVFVDGFRWMPSLFILFAGLGGARSSVFTVFSLLFFRCRVGDGGGGAVDFFPPLILFASLLCGCLFDACWLAGGRPAFCDLTARLAAIVSACFFPALLAGLRVVCSFLLVGWVVGALVGLALVGFCWRVPSLGLPFLHSFALFCFLFAWCVYAGRGGRLVDRLVACVLSALFAGRLFGWLRGGW
ncbi:hypothetical protein [Pseudomonas syringae]|uniref:hypothetical protein n=1 Tax=Pseudomonas syringae TaxID=317 RepID=UPI001144F9B4|nr:hypothetical protein [Pseudomonas syringae]